MIDSPQGWSAGANDAYQWMTIDAGKKMVFHGIAIQSRSNASRWGEQLVATFKVFMSDDGKTWTGVDDEKTLKSNCVAMEHGSGDGYREVIFSDPIETQYIKIVPVTW